MYGMVLAMAFGAFALADGIDRRVVHSRDPDTRCALAGLCHGCWKHADDECTVRRLLLFILPALAVLAFISLTAPTSGVSYDTTVFGAAQHFSHTEVYQLYALRLCPACAIVLLLASLALLLARRGISRAAQVLLAAGIGALGLAFLRATLLGLYRDDLAWFGFWEEATELLSVAAVAYVVWVFRHRLLAPRGGSPPTGGTDGSHG